MHNGVPEMMRPFIGRRFAAFVIVMAISAAGLRLWGDLDEATLAYRHPGIGHGRIWYRAPGWTLGYIINMPAAIISTRMLPEPLPYRPIVQIGLRSWVAEFGIILTQATLTSLFWIILGNVVRRMRNTMPRPRPGLFLIDTLAALALFSWAVLVFVEGFQHARHNLIGSWDWALLHDSSLIDSVLPFAMALWSIGPSLLFSWGALRQIRAHKQLPSASP